MRAAVVTTICILGVAGAAFAVFRHYGRKAQPVRDLSRMLSVRVTVDGALSAYYRDHGSYPHALSELPLQRLRWGDERSSLRDLEHWHYTSDGQSFRMTWTNTRHNVLILGGTNGASRYD